MIFTVWSDVLYLHATLMLFIYFKRPFFLLVYRLLEKRDVRPNYSNRHMEMQEDYMGTVTTPSYGNSPAMAGYY